jgi:hypothetical protein
MQGRLTLSYCFLISLAAASACTGGDSLLIVEGPADTDRGRDAGALDAGRTYGAQLDGTAPALDAQAIDARARDDAQAGDAQAGDAQAVVDAQALLAARLAQLTTSQTTWQALHAASPGPYWYAEENCMDNSDKGSFFIIQVEPTTSRVFEQRTIERAECEARVDRYGSLFNPNGGLDSVEELYDLCAAQLRNEPRSSFALDTRGVIKACWFGGPEDCKDSCGSGFYLRDWQFGLAHTIGDAGVHQDGGVRADAGS